MLTVPDLSEKTEAAVETRPSKTEKWLKSLPFINKFETSRQLYVALMGLNRLMLDDKIRFKLLELYREPIKRLGEELQQEYLDRAQPLFTNLKMMAEQNRQFQQELAIGYKHIILSMTEAGKIKPGMKSGFLATVLLRAISYCKETLLKSYYYYADVPPGIWQEIHGLYLIAEKTGCTNMAVKDPLNPIKESVSITEYYKHVLLLGFSNPYHMPPSFIRKIDHFLYRWADLTQFGPGEEITEGNCQFIIDQQGDMVGNSYTGDINIMEGASPLQYRALYTHDLARFIHSKLKAMENEQEIDTEGLEDRFYTDQGRLLLIHLINTWGINPKRQFARVDKPTTKLELAIGIKAINYFINGKKKMQPSSDFVGPFPERTAVGASGVQPGTKKKDRNLSTSTWNVVDESAGGVALAHNALLEEPTRVGELVAIRLLGQGDKWEIATIRWLRAADHAHIESGVQRLAPYATPILIKMINEDGKETDFIPALQLPGVKALNQPRTLVTHKGIFQKGRELYFDDSKGMKKITVCTLIEETLCYERFDYLVSNIE